MIIFPIIFRFFIHLSDRESSIPLIDSSYVYSNQKWAQAKASNLELHLVLPGEWQRSSYLSHHLLLPTVPRSRKLHQEPSRTPVWDAGVSTAVLGNFRDPRLKASLAPAHCKTHHTDHTFFLDRQS